MKRLALVILLLCSAPGWAWFSGSYTASGSMYIAALNTTVTGPTAVDGVTVSLPITVHIRLSAAGKTGPAFVQAKLQTAPGASGGTWTDVTPLLTIPNSGSLADVKITHTVFGNSTLAALTKGAAYRVRLWVSDGVQANASTAVDTTAAGTNGWDNLWVVGFTAHATNTKPGMPGN
jgi:hypothetical protein